MSKTGLVTLAAVAACCLIPVAALADGGASKLIRHAAAAQIGLERAWFAQVHVDTGADKLASVTQQTSFDPEVAYQVFEVRTDDGRTFSYSERDRAAFGRPLGVDGAKQMAQNRMETLTADGKQATLVERVIPHTILMAQTRGGMLHVFDAETGKTLWSRNVGRNDYPSTAAAANNKYVAMLNGLMLYVFHRADGRLAWERKVGGAPSAGPALSEEVVFIPMAGGKVEGYQLESPRDPAWSYKAAGQILVQPTVTPRSVAIATDRGWMYVSRPDNPAVRFRLEARGAIVTPPAYRYPLIYAASQDGYLYAMHETAGGTSWRFSAGMPIDQPVAAVGNAVYVSPERGGMYRLDATTGAEVWKARLANRFLAASEKRVYAVDPYRRLTVVEADSGGVSGQLPTGQLDLPIVNQETDRIYLADSSGLIQCLHEIDAQRPFLHVSANPTEPPIQRAEDPMQPAEDADVPPADDAAPGLDFPEPDDAAPGFGDQGAADQLFGEVGGGR